MLLASWPISRRLQMIRSVDTTALWPLLLMLKKKKYGKREVHFFTRPSIPSHWIATDQISSAIAAAAAAAVVTDVKSSCAYFFGYFIGIS